MRFLITIGASIALVQATVFTSPSLLARQSGFDISNLPAPCNSTCQPMVDFSLACSQQAEDVAKCTCVPEFVTYTNVCAECVGNNLNPKPEDWDSEIDENYKEFLEICKEVGVTTLPPVRTATSGASTTSAATTTNGAATSTTTSASSTTQMATFNDSSAGRKEVTGILLLALFAAFGSLMA